MEIIMENQNISDPTQKMNISIEIIAHIFSVLNNKSNEYVKKKLRAHGYSIVVPNHGPVLKEIQDVEEGITVREIERGIHTGKRLKRRRGKRSGSSVMAAVVGRNSFSVTLSGVSVGLWIH